MIESRYHNGEPDAKTKNIYKKFVAWIKPRLLESIGSVLMDPEAEKPDSAYRKAVDLIVDYRVSVVNNECYKDQVFKELTEEAAFCWFARCIAWQYMKNKKMTDLGLLETCHKYHPYIDLFQEAGDYTEDVFKVDDEIYKRLEELPLDSIFQVGWIYQYYNADVKDEFYQNHKKHNKKTETEKDLIAATCIYTPYWVVRYMTENSLGRVWINHLGAIGGEEEKKIASSFGWSYYLPTADQPPKVYAELKEINKSFANLAPQDITFLEPCMGTGLILLAAFDILIQIYEDAGIDAKDAVRPIFEKNLYGVDIDPRAWRLAKFNLMMRAAEIDPSILTEKIDMHLTAPLINGRDVDLNKLMWFGTEVEGLDKIKALSMFQLLCRDFEVVKKVGSLAHPSSGLDIELMRRYINSPEKDMPGLEATQLQMNNYLDLLEIALRKYDVVVTNPPYLSSSKFDDDLKNFFKSGAIDIPEDMDPWKDVYFPYLSREFTSNLYPDSKLKTNKNTRKRKGHQKKVKESNPQQTFMEKIFKECESKK